MSLSQKEIAVRFLRAALPLARSMKPTAITPPQTLSITILIMLVIRLLLKGRDA